MKNEIFRCFEKYIWKLGSLKIHGGRRQMFGQRPLWVSLFIVTGSKVEAEGGREGGREEG